MINKKKSYRLATVFRTFIVNRNAKIVFFISGFLSVVWITFRLITKPSRASYPCIRASYPIASAFVLYLSGTFASFISYKYAGKFARKSKYTVAFLCISVALVIGFVTFQINKRPVFANISNSYVSNSPIGEPKGVMPGRVVWYHHPGATDENWNKNRPDNYYAGNHTNIDTVETMINASILKLTETTSIDQAWDSLFVYFNKQHAKGAVSYQQGEQIFMKCNFVTAFDQQNDGGPTWTSP